MESAQYLECERQQIHVMNEKGKAITQITLDDDYNLAEYKPDILKIIEEKGLKQISDNSAIEKIVNDVLAANQKSVDDYRGGKTNALGYLVGQCMKASKGQANPAMCKELVLKYLNG